jgi:1,6-anhydro-N-acetylmuramate kinase
MDLSIGEADQHFVSLLHSGSFEVKNDLGEKWISAAQFRNDKTHRMTSAARQGTRLKIRAITNFLYHRFHAPGQSGVDGLGIVDDSRNRRMRNTRATGNLSNVHRLSPQSIVKMNREPVSSISRTPISFANNYPAQLN